MRVRTWQIHMAAASSLFSFWMLFWFSFWFWFLSFFMTWHYSFWHAFICLIAWGDWLNMPVLDWWACVSGQTWLVDCWCCQASRQWLRDCGIQGKIPSQKISHNLCLTWSLHPVVNDIYYSRYNSVLHHFSTEASTLEYHIGPYQVLQV